MLCMQLKSRLNVFDDVIKYLWTLVIVQLILTNPVTISMGHCIIQEIRNQN